MNANTMEPEIATGGAQGPIARGQTLLARLAATVTQSRVEWPKPASAAGDLRLAARPISNRDLAAIEHQRIARRIDEDRWHAALALRCGQPLRRR
jgi:hypothetical protein